ncbi:hypothetical protein DSM112329_03876 [Paraconexibacter sp. AEG42_29]|uniref:Calx-beta domain-containing protein n=1 Tax=Paraconexibacter sp. AEG42_29 TaxID=2997339 RepID=A0AAU7AZ59_9ACTN
MTVAARLARCTAAALVPLALAAAAFGPAEASAAPLRVNVPSFTVVEGSLANIRVPLRCPSGGSAKCVFSTKLEGGTARDAAKPGGDFSGLDPSRYTFSPGKSWTMLIKMFTKDDNVCEPPESFAVKVTTVQGRQFRADIGRITIVDKDDCRPVIKPSDPVQPSPIVPAPAPVLEPSTPVQPSPVSPQQPTSASADSGTPTITSTPTSTGAMQSCRTPLWIGDNGAFGAHGFYNSGCIVQVTCPQAVQVCSASAESGISSERGVGDQVTLNSRIRVFSASMSEFFHRDQSCAGTNFCRTEDKVMIRGGETASVQCNGVRVTPTQANRSAVTCSLVVERAG